MIAGRCLVDTNVLVHVYDRSDPAKQKRAFDVVDRLAMSGRGALSAQILSEFFVVVTRKIPDPLPVPHAIRSVENYLRAWPVLAITPNLIYEALRGTEQNKMPYWDALIWATAKLNQISIILSEDFSDGRVLEGVQFVNPFAQNLDVL
jgi:predicted nucleic acid-binding protein